MLNQGYVMIIVFATLYIFFREILLTFENFCGICKSQMTLLNSVGDCYEIMLIY